VTQKGRRLRPSDSDEVTLALRSGGLSTASRPKREIADRFSIKSCGCESALQLRGDMDREAAAPVPCFYSGFGVGTLYRRQKMQDRTQTLHDALPGLAPENDRLLKILEDIGAIANAAACIVGRKKIVFGSGKRERQTCVRW